MWSDFLLHFFSSWLYLLETGLMSLITETSDQNADLISRWNGKIILTNLLGWITLHNVYYSSVLMWRSKSDVLLALVCTDFFQTWDHTALSFCIWKARYFKKKVERNAYLKGGRGSLNSFGTINLGSARSSNATGRESALPITFNDKWFPGAVWNRN